MKTLSIRSIPDDVHAKLRVRAARNGRSMEAEARALLEKSVAGGDADKWVGEIQTLAKQMSAKRKPRNMVDGLLEERRREVHEEAQAWSSSTRRRS
mgnify:CR=1 FL=1